MIFPSFLHCFASPQGDLPPALSLLVFLLSLFCVSEISSTSTFKFQLRVNPSLPNLQIKCGHFSLMSMPRPQGPRDIPLEVLHQLHGSFPKA